MAIPKKPLDITIENANGLGYWGYIKHVIANAGNGSGRASRAEYWSFFTFILGVMAIQVGLDRMVVDHWQHDIEPVIAILSFGPLLVLAVSLFSLSARRFHDFGWSGWWAVTNIWPLHLSVPGQPYENPYGLHPKSKAGSYSLVPQRTFFSALREGMNSMAWLLP